MPSNSSMPCFDVKNHWTLCRWRNMLRHRTRVSSPMRQQRQANWSRMRDLICISSNSSKWQFLLSVMTCARGIEVLLSSFRVGFHERTSSVVPGNGRNGRNAGEDDACCRHRVSRHAKCRVQALIWSFGTPKRDVGRQRSRSGLHMLSARREAAAAGDR